MSSQKISIFKELEAKKENTSSYEVEQNYEDDLMLENENDDWENESDLEVGKKLKFKLEDLELDRWLADLKSDKDAFKMLYSIANQVSAERDAKLLELKKLIKA